MPGGWDSYGQAIAADGPVGWYRFNELLAGSAVAAGSQDPQNFCFDSSINGNRNQAVPPFPNGNFLQYGSAVLANQSSLLVTNGITSMVTTGDPGGSALFPSTGTASTINIATGGTNQPAILQPTTAITVEAWFKGNVMTTGSVKQVLVCYGSDASSLAAYNLYHLGSSATNHVFAFSVNIGGTLRTATATTPSLATGTIYYATGVYDGTNVRIYVNGVLGVSTAITGSISYASLGGYGLAFGNDPSLTDANLQGYLDEVAIYNYALNATRIAYHYREGSTYLPFVWNH
jgi:Concanavalin A-like lectin/glucanases superfamily